MLLSFSKEAIRFDEVLIQSEHRAISQTKIKGNVMSQESKQQSAPKTKNKSIEYEAVSDEYMSQRQLKRGSLDGYYWRVWGYLM